MVMPIFTKIRPLGRTNIWVVSMIFEQPSYIQFVINMIRKVFLLLLIWLLDIALWNDLAYLLRRKSRQI